ncbi:hypothetical protein OXYTRIMIC_425 [Oxytricha trifallax]|uniref:Uncharacterized protein n=1 Tax=Oxytricha trifallax TaxID=1172189 RepID=A0A073IBT6_9SPIT|nr:hypothetical protein OXYTRIMIC_425 [Oxytricha trifallax]
MENDKQLTSRRRKLTMEDKGHEVKVNLHQQTLYKYFEYSNSHQNSLNSVYQNMNVQLNHNHYKNINKFSVKFDNSRQLEFYQPVREAEGWVRRNERIAEKWISKKKRGHHQQEEIDPHQDIRIQNLPANCQIEV